MTTISVEVRPRTIMAKTSAHGLPPDQLDEFEGSESMADAFLEFRGRAKYGGTYARMDIEFTKGTAAIQLPRRACLVFRRSAEIASKVGEVCYLESMNDEELGIVMPDQIQANVDLHAEHFDNVWRLLVSNRARRLSAGISFQAPEAGPGPGMVKWDISKTGDSWSPIVLTGAWISARVPNSLSEQRHP